MPNGMNKEKGIQIAKILKALIELNKVAKILDSFLPVFLNKTIPKKNRVWLHGSFNLGGTASGRLSSSKPNLQQIPSGSTYAKLIKECFVSPPGWLMIGADFNALTLLAPLLSNKYSKLF